MKKKFLSVLITLFISGAVSKAQTGCAAPVNLVSNSDFNSGRASFSSAIPASAGCGVNSYTVESNFNLKCTSWPNVTDHTAGAAPRNFLIIDGSTSNLQTVWQQTVNVCQGKKYTFSFWANSIYNEAFTLAMKIGTTTVNTGSITQGAWTQYSTSWWGAPGVTTLSIVQNTGGQKRDFGIDDVFFGYCCNPVSVSGNTSIACGSATSFTAYGAVNYTWTSASGSTTGNTFTANPTSTTVYTVTGSDGCACITPTTFTINVTPGTPFNPDFALAGNTIIGNSTDFNITASPIVSTASFFWEISELDLVTSAIVPNTTMTNAQTWWYAPFIANNTFPGYNWNYTNYAAWPASSPMPTPPYSGSGIPAKGVLKLGHKYRITRGTWGQCAPWASISKTIYLCSGCKTATGDAFIIENDSYSPAMPQGLMLATSITPVKLNVDEESTIFPNPNNGVFTLSLNSKSLKDIYIYDVTGKVVYENKGVNDNEIIIDLNDYSKGIFIVRITDGKTSITKKVITH
ncbi:MAG: type sorting protein [Bacteroidetes bacterium]|nr:type sorting protein [Bacteroidota bacterium]